MPVLRNKFNYGWIEFRAMPGSAPSGGSIGVYINGEVVQKKWLGFIDRLEAQSLGYRGIAKPVRMKVDCYAGDEIGYQWCDVPDSQSIQGCLVEDGVYAVTETQLRLI